jgi:hypothetical protein
VVQLWSTEKKELYRFFKLESDAEIRNNTLLACPFWHSTLFFRKSAIDKVGGYKNLKIGEYWELRLRLGKIRKFYNFKEYFSLYLNTGNNFSLKTMRSL